MLGLSGATRILLFISATDMRKGFDGLSTLVMAAGEDLYSGHLFVFVSRRRDRAKILTFQKGGLVLWYKCLDRGVYRIPLRIPAGIPCVKATRRELELLLEGINRRTLTAGRRTAKLRRRTES